MALIHIIYLVQIIGGLLIMYGSFHTIGQAQNKRTPTFWTRIELAKIAGEVHEFIMYKLTSSIAVLILVSVVLFAAAISFGLAFTHDILVAYQTNENLANIRTALYSLQFLTSTVLIISIVAVILGLFDSLKGGELLVDTGALLSEFLNKWGLVIFTPIIFCFIVFTFYNLFNNVFPAVNDINYIIEPSLKSAKNGFVIDVIFPFSSSVIIMILPVIVCLSLLLFSLVVVVGSLEKFINSKRTDVHSNNRLDIKNMIWMLS